MILPFWVFLSFFLSISKHFKKYFIFPPPLLNIITKEKWADIWVVMIDRAEGAETDIISWCAWRQRQMWFWVVPTNLSGFGSLI